MWISNVIISFKCDQLFSHLLRKPSCPLMSYFLPGETWELRGLLSCWGKTYQHLRQMIVGWNITSITALLKRQLWSQRWQSSTFLFLCCFSHLQRFLFHVSLWVHQSSFLLCFEQQSFLSFFKPLLKNFCENSPHPIIFKAKFHP